MVHLWEDSPLAGRQRPVDPLVESLAKDFKRMRPLQANSTHRHARVTDYEGEMEGNYINLYDDELLGDIYLFGEKDVAAEREARRASHGRINPEGICQPGYCQPSEIPVIPYRFRLGLSRMRRARCRYIRRYV